MNVPDRGETVWFDTLVYCGVVLTAFGIGTELDRWLANDAYAAPLLYLGVLLVVYVKWVLPLHRD